jgi:hypothetical protein
MKRRVVHSVAVWCAIVLALTMGASIASARTHAVLVGVSSYPSLGERYQLTGPANDVLLFRQLLLDRSVSAADIRVLADGVEGGVLPSRKAILESFAALASEVTRGDLVFLLFAGHGSQQPATADGAEPDGLDEIFLPRDVGRWQGETRAVRNAITDDEIGAALQRLRARGALVWAVFDTCHAGTLARAFELPGQRERYIPPTVLGVEAAKLGALPHSRSKLSYESGGALRESAADAAGSYIYSYASQSHEITPELRLPVHLPAARVHGLFSYTLHRALSAAADSSYRQVMERVLQVYLSQGRQSPSPLYEGSMLDAAVFGDTTLQRPEQWLVERRGDELLLQVGELQGVGQGSILSLVATPDARDAQVLGHVQVVSSTLSSALLQPIIYERQPALPLQQVPSAAYARPVQLQTDFRLRAALLPQGPYCEVPSRDLRRAQEQLQHDPRSMPRLVWSARGEPADVYLCQRGAGVVVLDASGEVPDPSRRSLPGIALPDAKSAPERLATRILQQLSRVARVLNLSRLVAAHRQPAHLDVALEWQANCAGGKACSAAPRPLTRGTRQMCSGDLVTVKLTNPGFEPADVTILYIDAGYGITLLYPDARGEVARFEPKGKHMFTVNIEAEPSGVERLLILTARVLPQSPIVSFAGLAQQSLPMFARASVNPLDLWAGAAFGTNPFEAVLNATRGGRTTASASIGATTYTWTVVPRDSAKAACTTE